MNRPTFARLWRDDLVSFVIGCSFSFEEPLIAADIPIRHMEHAASRSRSMYCTNVPTHARRAGFAGPLVVSMRPLKPADAIRAVQITARLPAVHGAPVHSASRTLIGIRDLAASSPITAMRCRSSADELPVFWACGVTPQAAIAAARPPFAITTRPAACW